MNPREMSALIAAIFMAIGTVWYIICIGRKKINPVLASWIVLGGTILLSFGTYMTTPKASLISNIANTTGVASILSILFTVYLQKRKDVISFTPFQKKTLLWAGMIALLWIILVWGLGKTGFYPNILTQILMIIGYIATAQKLWHSEKNTESFLTWVCIGMSGVVALYTAIVSKDGLAMLYAIRGTVSAFTIVWLAYRADLKYQEATLLPARTWAD